MDGISFSVCAMVREQPEDLLRLVRFYHRAGAEEIRLYYDGTVEPSLRDLLSGVPGLLLIACDDSWWEARGGRPAVVEHRQIACMTDALGATRSEWLLGCDADEFVGGAADIGTFLAQVPPHVPSVRIAPAEAVYGPDDDVFSDSLPTFYRLPIDHRKFGRAVTFAFHGRDEGKFSRGLLGHTEGKTFLRTNASFSKIGIHGSTDPEGRWSKLQHKVAPNAPMMRLYHQDALSFPRWVEKCRRRQSARQTYSGLSPERIQQLQAFAKAEKSGEAGLLRLFERLYRLSPMQVAVLSRLNLLEQRDLFGEL